MNSLIGALTGKKAKPDKTAGARRAAAKSIILSGAQAAKACDRVLTQSLGSKKKEDPVKLLEALREEATLEEKLRQRALCLGYLALADQAFKAGGDEAPARALERLLLARKAGEDATRADAFCLLSHWALVRAAGGCWEEMKSSKPEEAPEAQAVLHKATAKARPPSVLPASSSLSPHSPRASQIITYVFIKQSPKFVVEFDNLLAVERRELGIPEKLTSALELSHSPREVVLSKLQECVREQLLAVRLLTLCTRAG